MVFSPDPLTFHRFADILKRRLNPSNRFEKYVISRLSYDAAYILSENVYTVSVGIRYGCKERKYFIIIGIELREETRTTPSGVVIPTAAVTYARRSALKKNNI